MSLAGWLIGALPIPIPRQVTKSRPSGLPATSSGGGSLTLDPSALAVGPTLAPGGIVAPGSTFTSTGTGPNRRSPFTGGGGGVGGGGGGGGGQDLDLRNLSCEQLVQVRRQAARMIEQKCEDGEGPQRGQGRGRGRGRRRRRDFAGWAPGYSGWIDVGTPGLHVMTTSSGASSFATNQGHNTAGPNTDALGAPVWFGGSLKQKRVRQLAQVGPNRAPRGTAPRPSCAQIERKIERLQAILAECDDLDHTGEVDLDEVIAYSGWVEGYSGWAPGYSGWGSLELGALGGVISKCAKKRKLAQAYREAAKRATGKAKNKLLKKATAAAKDAARLCAKAEGKTAKKDARIAKKEARRGSADLEALDEALTGGSLDDELIPAEDLDMSELDAEAPSGGSALGPILIGGAIIGVIGLAIAMKPKKGRKE